MTATAAEEWQHWTEARAATVSAPHGQLALTGTYWLEPEPTELPGLPGRWWAGSDGLVRVDLKAEDGIRFEHGTRVGTGGGTGDGRHGSGGGHGDGALDGEVTLRPDTDPEPQLAVHGDRRLVPIEREGELALRVFDPASPARTAFVGISTYPYSADWAVSAVFTPFEDGEQSVVVPSADGKDRPLEVTGRIAFTLAGEQHTLTVARSGNRLSGVIADATSGHETYRFRFITLPAPDADGRTVLDLNRAYLPPCAFADHFVCPFPPPGNRLTVAVEAGEKHVVSA